MNEKACTAGVVCPHGELERLGTNNGMAFARCLTCLSVIIIQDGISIVLPASPGAQRAEAG
jgi:hypothetical protein